VRAIFDSDGLYHAMIAIAEKRITKKDLALFLRQQAEGRSG
jgi:hypothetical protein